MLATNRGHKTMLPGRFDELVRLMPPQAIVDDGFCVFFFVLIDHFLASGTLTKGQESYLETLVQLVQAYEASRHAIPAAKGIDALRHLLEEHNLSASDLARLLGVHPSMGSKILKGERSLTVDHLKRLGAQFKVRADTFMD